MSSQRLSRRSLVCAAASLATTLAAAHARATPPAFRHLDLRLAGALPEARRAKLLVPSALEGTADVGAVVLLHGFRCARDECRAIDAWRNDFGVELAHARLSAVPFEPVPDADAFHRLRAGEINQAFGQRPFGGLVMICPRTVIPYHRPEATRAYADWLVDVLVPRVRELLPVGQDRVALAGVSMGGRVGLEVMAARPDGFAGFVGLQCDVKRDEVAKHADGLQAAFERVGPRGLELVSSTLDPYLEANLLLASELERRGVPRGLQITPGNHNAAWVRSTGAVEALFRAERLVNRLPGVASVLAAR